MPKISYLDILDNGADYTEVTASHIEQKIADIEALLRGMIDEDNMLCAPDGTSVVPLSPSNVADMPIETRPVQHCMKFFGKTGDHTESIRSTLYDDLVSVLEAKPELIMLNGIGDKEIIIDFIPDTRPDEQTFQKSMEIEIPNYYVPVTYRQIWEIVSSLKCDLKLLIDTGSGMPWEEVHDVKVEGQITSLDEFMRSIIKTADPDDFAVEEYITLSENRLFFASPVDFNLKRNMLSFTLQACAKDSESGGLYRYTVSSLCRVNP